MLCGYACADTGQCQNWDDAGCWYSYNNLASIHRIQELPE